MKDEYFENLKNTIILPHVTKIKNSGIQLREAAIVSEKPLNSIKIEIENYERITASEMNHATLDRHKLSAVLCGAIMKAKPFKETPVSCKSLKMPNELLAVLVAIENLKPFMVKSYLEEYFKHTNEKIIKIMCSKYAMEFPNILIRDKKNYIINLMLSLHRAFSTSCKDTNCDKFDIWAYAKIFYHLELHNRQVFDEFCNTYTKSPRNVRAAEFKTSQSAK